MGDEDHFVKEVGERLLTLLGFVGLGIIISTVLLFVFRLITRAAGVPLQPSSTYPVATLIQGAGLISAALIYFEVSDTTLDIDIPSKVDIGLIAGGVVLLFVVGGIVGVVLRSAGISSAENAVTQVGSQNPEIFLYLIPLSIIAVGTSEELVFRGMVQGGLEELLGTNGAIITASLIFGLLHVFALQGSLITVLITVIPISILGMILGYFYVRTRNIVVPILIHGFYNASLFAFYYLVEKGIVSASPF